MEQMGSLLRTLSPTELKILIHKKLSHLNVPFNLKLNFQEFVEYAITPYLPEMGELYEIHKLWINIIEVQYPEDNIMLFAPVDSWKSTILAVDYPLYLMYLTNSLIRIGVFSEKEDLSVKRIIQARQAIESVKILGELGIKKPANPNDWGERSFTIDRGTVISGSTMKAFGIEAATQGYKIDVGILDDVVSLANSSTEGNRRRLREKFRREVLSRLTQKPPAPLKASRFLSIGTSFHRDDLNHELGKGFEGSTIPPFKEFRFRAIYEESEKLSAPGFVQKQIEGKKFMVRDLGDDNKRPIGLLFPEHHILGNYKKLMTKKDEQGSRFFSQNYLQVPISDEDMLIQMDWVIRALKPKMIMGPDLWLDILRHHGFILFFLMDPAIIRNKSEAKRKDSDYWVMEADAYNAKEDMRVIVDFRRSRGNSKQELLSISKDFYESFAVPNTGVITREDAARLPYKWYVEQVQAQDFLIQDMEEIFGKSFVRGLKTTYISKNDKMTGLPGVSLMYEKGGLWIPTGDERSMGYAKVVMEEATGYPSNTTHDDTFSVSLMREQAIAGLRSFTKILDPNSMHMPKAFQRTFSVPSPSQRYSRYR
jgi:hypothetical protein